VSVAISHLLVYTARTMDMELWCACLLLSFRWYPLHL